MGWWKVQDSDDVVGDEVFSTLRSAAKSVVKAYQREFGRLPTQTEWQLLMSDAVQPDEHLDSDLKDYRIAGNCTPLLVKIVLTEE